MTKQEIKGREFLNPIVFTDGHHRLECFEVTNIKQSWIGKFGLDFNGRYESFKTFQGFNNRVTKLIEKFNLS